ncbi:zinc finger protein 675 isoform X2 [Zerene cesonia]|uniref:zinc finger protein 675 isoform X2 n=1 Tax=Zerene cesonia TaxID=33412 RepID=UPI0018E57DA1|nr:zinc finger protein 675 isoform X2 [Zerene cesonia]
MNKICRICLEEGVLSSVFAKNYNLSLCDMIEYCSNVKIQKDDGLPEQMCSNCAYKLGIAFHFKQTCERSDIRLRQYLGLELTSKYKDANINTEPIVMTKTTIIKKCKCMGDMKKPRTNYKKKPDCDKLKRGPKVKPKKVHECYECHKQFRCQAQLEMHVWTHTGEKPFACVFCSRRFTQKHNLTIHLQMHTGEKPFQCEICSKRFSAQGNLQAHIKTHTGQKDHVCAVCNKAFITSSELTRHMTKHTGIRNFKCDICGKSYSQNRDLRLHKLRKHDCVPNEPESQKDAFNTNIDIVDVDEVKNIPSSSVKETNHFPSLHLSNKNPEHSLITQNHTLPYEDKGIKDIFSHSVFG